MLKSSMLLQERYEIIELIGSGGMAQVYQARCHKLDRFVAIKVLKEEFCSDANFVDKFKMEAQSVAKLSHPNLVNVYDVVDDGDLHYIVMEYIEGITLKKYIAKRGKLQEKEAIGIALQVAQGIAAAHSLNIIHRDIKPHNMLISKDGKVKVADFGIARVSTTQTLNANAIGSVHYISPEQARGGLSDMRSDIYSLGITMYEMVTGRVPFEGENTVAVALAHLDTVMTSPRFYQSALSEAFEAIICKCTEKKPSYRYPDMTYLIQDLRKILMKLDAPVKEEENFSDTTAQTIMIGSKEMEQIRKTPIPEVPKNVQHEKITSRQPDPRSVRKGQDLSGQNKEKQKNKKEDENTYLEMIFTGARILIALVIIAVLLFVFSKVANLLSFTSQSINESTPLAETVPPITIETSESETEIETLSSKEVYMPNLFNMTEEQAERMLKEKDLVMKVITEQSDKIPEGMVISQKEVAGTVVPKYSDVHVVISEGNPMISVADLLPEGVSTETAKTILENKKIVVTIKEEHSDIVAAHRIIRYEPAQVKEGETVILYVSLGSIPVLIPVPDIAGKLEDEAGEMIVQAGLTVGQISFEFNDTVPEGRIIRYDGGGESKAPGSSISYVVSKGIEVINQRYVGSIAETYNLSNLIGPGSGTTSVDIMIRLRQHINGKDVLTTKMPPTTITGDVLLPINFKFIEGAPGVDRGYIEVVEVTSGSVLKSYEIRFFPME